MKLLLCFILFFIAIISCNDVSVHTNDIVVGLGSGINPVKYASDHNLKYISSVLGDISDNIYLFRVKNKAFLSGKYGKAFLNKLRAHDGVEFVEPQIKTRRYKRSKSIPRVLDPKYGAQWHLHGVPSVSLNIDAALNQGIDGSGKVIAIVDDGVEFTHPDLKDRVNRELCWDFNEDHRTNCRPYRTDGHGTSAAGMAAASRNGVCGIGTASGATIAGLRLLAGAVSDMTEAAALSYRRNEIDIYSNSWGPIDDGKRFSGAGRLSKLALATGASKGRNGLGNIFVWAGGNGRQQKDNCNRDSYANSRHTISVGAINHNGRIAYYSEPCAELMVVVPSSGSGHGLMTTDLEGSAGYDRSECTNKFGGTSGAAPQVAGVVADMLQLRPGLTKRDVEGILARSAIRVLPQDKGWSTNAKGYSHHHDFGFGRVDLKKTLDEVKVWKKMPKQRVCRVPLTGINKNIPYAMSKNDGLQVNLNVANSCGIDSIEHIEVKTYIRHRHRGQVVVSITAPDGITSVLTEANRDYSADYPMGGWKFGSVRHWGSNPVGNWVFSVYDSKLSSYKGLASWVELTIYGH